LLKQSEINLVKNIDRYGSKKTIFASDIDEDIYKRGRPFGGQAWCIEKSFKIIHHDFPNKFFLYLFIRNLASSHELVNLSFLLSFVRSYFS
jgi:hypothetical protein